MRIIFFLLTILFSLSLFSQDSLHSKYGKSLAPYGTIRILIIYAEIDFDVNPEKNPQAHFTYSTWKPGQLPQWKDEMADPHPGMNGNGLLTQYYNESSFGKMQVLGDYIPKVITIKESETKSSAQTFSYNQKVIEKICEDGVFKTANNLSINDFDLWTLTSFAAPKITPSKDNPPRIDHLMIIYRNIHTLAVDNGFASQSNIGQFCGNIITDTYSTFSSPDKLPFNVPKHELAHLLMGDNNFHPYGKTVRSQSYLMFQQAVHSILSAANATLLTCNAWDRDRFDWKGPGKNLTISALNETNQEVSTDLNSNDATGAGVYILRDFVSTGDALRIKLPVIDPENKYPQWLWVENHRTVKNNGSRFDQFQYQQTDCTDEATPGLYMYVQVAKNEKTGQSIYGGYDNYLRSVIANGNYDWKIEKEKIPNNCVSSVPHYPFIKYKPNPFTGSHYLENALFDLNGDGKLEDSEAAVFAIEKINGEIVTKLGGLGDADNAFSIKNKRKISISTNPSTAALINPEYNIRRLGTPANRSILLNGVSIEIIEELNDGSIKIKVSFNDTDIFENTRWCADTIYLHQINNKRNFDLNILDNVQLHIDQGITPTRFNDPVVIDGENIFTSPSTFICSEQSSINMNKKSEVIIDNNSHFILEKDAKLFLGERAKIVVKNGGYLKIDPSAEIIMSKRARIEIDKSSRIEYTEKSVKLYGKRARIVNKGKRIINLN